MSSSPAHPPAWVLGCTCGAECGALPGADQDRCPSCEHGREYHSERGCGYTVTVGRPDKPMNCPCGLASWPADSRAVTG